MNFFSLHRYEILVVIILLVVVALALWTIGTAMRRRHPGDYER